MRTKLYLVALASFASLGILMLSSCSKNTQKSLSDLKSEQSDAIKNFIATNKLKVTELKTNDLPSSIDTETYYHLKNGLYLRVIDKGDMSKKAVLGETNVYALLKGYQFSKETSQTRSFDNLSKANVAELHFRYVYTYNAGDLHFNIVENTRPVLSLDDLMCQGIAFPVTMLGNGAKVALIIPFELGPSATYSKGLSTYVSELHYTYK